MRGFEQIITQMGDFAAVCRDVETPGRTPALVTGLSGMNRLHFVASVAQQSGKNALVLVEDDQQAQRICENLNLLFGQERAIYFPARELTFRDVESVSREYEHFRLRVLGRLLRERGQVVVSSVPAAALTTIAPDALRAKVGTIRQGSQYQLEKIVESLVQNGYERTEQVEGVCQFAVRGGILDFYSPDSPHAVRAEFWGDEIDTLSYFSTESQRRIEAVDAVEIFPAREVLCDDPNALCETLRQTAATLRGKAAALARKHIQADIDQMEGGITPASLDRFLPLLYPEHATLFDYFAPDDLLFVFELPNIREQMRGFLAQHAEDLKILMEEGVLFRGCDQFYCDYDDLCGQILKKRAVLLSALPRSMGELPIKQMYAPKAVQLSPWGGDLDALMEDLSGYLDRGYCCIVLAGTEKNAKILTSDLDKQEYPVAFCRKLETIQKRQVFVMEGSFPEGFEYPDIGVCVISHAKMAAVSSKKHPRALYKKGKQIQNLSDLTPGDYVVHSAHGIGIFEGIIKREVQGVVKDYIKIRYAGTDALFVPVTQLDLVTKYVGASAESGVRLNKLNSVEWNKTKQRVKAAVSDMAKELVALYAARSRVEGYAFSPDSDWQRDFEARFPYEETDDQLRCVQEIKEDMQSHRPMDRLLCGDVGFGKTEVALRGAFKCVLDSKQCAVLVPTTILAWQHFQTFTERMKDFPVKIEMLSRFRTPKQQEQILRDLKAGNIDIIIGTHRLVQEDVKFKDLGLVIIDEEQRFGVAQKEKLKKLRNTVDILTLSATPIPRTLNMAMSGIRDMSIIEEAPADRHPVQTYVMEYDPTVIEQAIKRELRRNGQVFYLHNRVESIDSCARRIEQMVPDARIVVAHGKMNEEALSRIWKQMMDYEADILVCTTIIETGVDLQNCNTLIIEDADRFGLSQLYQLRGRVGRSTRRAYAYLTFRRDKVISEIATKRLTAIREFTTFGSGFRIAMRDLEIRGAGNILGDQQHGHMAAVGYEMYLRMLEEAVAEQKGEPKKSTAECMVDISVGAHIPNEYIQNLSQRIDIYKKIASIQNKEDSMDVIDELIDRFGDPPGAVLGLIDVSLIRNTAASLGIREISQNRDSIVLYPDPFDLAKASALASKLRGRVLVNAGSKPYITVRLAKGEAVVETIRKALDAMQESSDFISGHLKDGSV